jgi:ubiquinone/menaquinone biosynthesis C-methylase UbiE
LKKKILQKKIFLDGEGDNWLSRNKKNIDKKKLTEFHNILKCIKEIVSKSKKKRLNILEVGSSDGKFLDFLRKNLSFCKFFGIDPSKEAINQLNKKKLKGKVATADDIPYKKNSMDIIFYGFCLYLCDKSDYKKIFLNAKRVLKNNGYLIIYDFFSKKFKKNKYKHDNRIFSYKMDFRKIFSNNKFFFCLIHKEFKYGTGRICKNTKNYKKDIVAISILKKGSIKDLQNV